ncbi:MAG: acyl-CoA dehydrogenase family protein [Planctomycetota bacterium]|nr:acyl-CoA dehydrogenase family protein [Planctomycetota bacterium]MDA1113928.1 acyl-CoA dehydrogenase family protein [Planctomycetota bacterium]
MNPLFNITFTEEQLAWREKAHEIAVKHLLPNALKHDKESSFNEAGFKAAADAGMLGVWIPKEYGGSGDGIMALALMVEEFSKADPAFGVAFAVNALGSIPIIVGGTHEQKAKYLPLVASGKAACAFALSEKFAGSDAGGLSVRAEKEGDTWTIRGEKKWTTNGSRANIITCFAVTDPNSRSRRISAFIVEDTDPGFSIKKLEDKMGIRAVPVCETVFDGIKLGDDRLIGGVPGLGFKHSMMTLDLARPGVAAQAVGTAAGALELATVYAGRRKQFGQAISGFQMIQAMLADMAQQTEAARWLVYQTAAQADAGYKGVTKIAAMAKCFATDVAVKVATDAVQIFGGYGFMEDYPIAKYYRDAKILQIYEGTNQIQRIVIARNLIKESMHLDYYNAVIPSETQESFGADPVTANV